MRLTVITPVFNGARFIQKCLENVLSQGVEGIEHLIVDGASTDATCEIVRAYAKSHPHVRLVSARDRGQSDAMNRGLALARGRAISFLNVDDEYCPGTIAEALSLLELQPEPAMVVGNCEVLDGDRNRLYVSTPQCLDVDSILIARPGSIYPINPAAYFYHKSLHDAAGGFDVEDHQTMDVDFLLRAFALIKPQYVPKTWAIFCLHGASKTALAMQSDGLRAQKRSVFRRHLSGLPVGRRARIRTIRTGYKAWAAARMAATSPSTLVAKCFSRGMSVTRKGTLLSGWFRERVVKTLWGPGPALTKRHYAAVIFKVDRIGDFVLAISAIRRLVEHFGGDNCLLVVSPHAAALARQEFPECEVEVVRGFPGRLLRDFAPKAIVDKWRFGGVSADNLICLRHQRAVNHTIALSWIRAKRTYGFENDLRCQLEIEKNFPDYEFSVEVPNEATNSAQALREGSCSELERHRLLLGQVFGRGVPTSEILPALADEVTPPNEPFILVSPLGTQSIRTLPAKTLIAALKRIQEIEPWQIRLAGSADQTAALESLAAQARSAGVVQIGLAASPTFEAFRELVATASLVIATESAGAHLAAALDRPAVIVIGGGHYGIFAPWKRSARQVWLTAPMECFGCDWSCRKSEAFCITQVPAAAIGDAALNLLQAAPAAALARVATARRPTVLQ